MCRGRKSADALKKAGASSTKPKFPSVSGLKKQRFASISALRKTANEGQQGEFFEANQREAFWKRQARRERRNKDKSRILFALPVEQTPFGPVTAEDSHLSEWVEDTGRKPQFIGTEPDDYKGFDASINYETWRGLGERINVRVARMILIELLETTMLNTVENQEEDKDRNERCQKRQAMYADEDATTRRIMAMTYALATFPEEQRSGAGKEIRAALLRIVKEQSTAQEAFIGDILDSAAKILTGGTRSQKTALRRDWSKLYKDGGPAVIQTGIGGKEYQRIYVGGGLAATEAHKGLQGDISVASDDEEEPSETRERSFKARYTLSSRLIAEQNEEKEEKTRKSLKRAGRSKASPTHAAISSEVLELLGVPDPLESKSKQQLRKQKSSKPVPASSAAGLKRRLDPASDDEQPPLPKRQRLADRQPRLPRPRLPRAAKGATQSQLDKL